MPRIIKNSKGATLIEYAFMLALILMAAIGAVQLFGERTNNSMNNTGSRLP